MKNQELQAKFGLLEESNETKDKEIQELKER